MEKTTKWPKVMPELTVQQKLITEDFMRHWHEVLAGSKRYTVIEKFNQNYAVKQCPKHFLTTLEIGAGLGEHLNYENLSPEQAKNYYALERLENMAERIAAKFPQIQTVVADCQLKTSFEDGYFDRIIAIHILEHLPNLPAAIQEMYRLCNKQNGSFSVVIPCEGGIAYSLARKISAQRVFERRYKQSYEWFIKKEHLNIPSEIMTELNRYFDIQHKEFFPLRVPSVNMNLCIGLTLFPKRNLSELDVQSTN